MSSISLNYAGSRAGTTTESIAGLARRMSHGSRPGVDIILDDHHEGKVYSTFDAIKGRVEITAPHDARFDVVAITFEGSTKTYVENLSPSATRSRMTALHKFLKLVMPVRESDYPTPRIAEAGQTYKFDFNFAVPEHLLPRACTHSCSTSHIHHAHLAVPPSMGEREVSGLDDMSPDMAKVTYAIRVKVLRHRERDGQEAVLVEGSKKLHVVPTVQEAAPLSLGQGFEDYVSSKTKSLKKGVFSGKLGHITVSAAQPNAFILPAPSSESTTAPTTMATVKLRFDPHEASSQPPRLGGLNTKIKSSTFYAARPAIILPSHYCMTSQFETVRGVYDASVSLSSRCVESVAWKRHEPKEAVERRGSDSSTSSSDSSDDTLAPELKPGRPYYTASVIVPITLPTNRSWVPTFHSCIVSRVYALDLSLSVHTPGTGVPATSITLHLPVQIAANGNLAQRAALTAAEAAAELADADAFMQPRVIEAPRQELVGNSVLSPSPVETTSRSELPPSYEDFLAQPRAVVSPGMC